MVVERGFTVAEASVVLVGSVALAEVDELLSDELLDELLASQDAVTARYDALKSPRAAAPAHAER